MGMKSGHKLLVEVMIMMMMIMVIQFNRPQMVDISLQVIHILMGTRMVNVMSG